MSKPMLGPWYYALNSNKNGFTLREGNTEDWLVVGTVPMTNDPQIAEMRARLIAASPDLLEACRHAVSDAVSDQFGTERVITKWAYEKLKAAIAKAENR